MQTSTGSQVGSRSIAAERASVRSSGCTDVARDLVREAEATLGWRIADRNRFLQNVRAHGLGGALNLEHNYLT